MAVGFRPTLANSILDALFRNVAWTPPTTWYVKLHLGDPGAAGTANPATETTRKSVTFNAASGGAITNSVAAQWTNYPASEDVTHVSIWDNVSAGNFLASGTVTADPIVAGTLFSLNIGAISASLLVAA